MTLGEAAAAGPDRGVNTAMAAVPTPLPMKRRRFIRGSYNLDTLLCSKCHAHAALEVPHAGCHSPHSDRGCRRCHPAAERARPGAQRPPQGSGEGGCDPGQRLPDRPDARVDRDGGHRRDREDGRSHDVSAARGQGSPQADAIGARGGAGRSRGHPQVEAPAGRCRAQQDGGQDQDHVRGRHTDRAERCTRHALVAAGARGEVLRRRRSPLRPVLPQPPVTG